MNDLYKRWAHRKFIVPSIVAALLIMATPAIGRDVYNLNAGWRFFDAAATSSDGAQSVSLPHRCVGGGNYLKELDVPAEWGSHRVWIKGYGGGPVVAVFVNGRLAGEHRGGYTAWQFEVTRLLEAGKRNYIYMVCTAAGRFDVLPTAGDMELTEGLFRDVELIVTGQTAVDDVEVVQREVSAERVEGEVRILVSGGAKEVNIEIYDDEERVAARGEARVNDGVAVVPFAIDGPRLWHGRRAPNLYTVMATAGGDSVSVVTGFRKVEADPGRGFILNGESYPLRGVVVHQDRPLTGAAISRYEVEEDVALILEMGANAVRVEGVAHHPAFYELCDREGIVVWSDFPLTGEAFLTDKGFVPTDGYRHNGRTQVQDILHQQRNHPCVAIWGVFSNLHARDDNPAEYVRELNAMAKSEGQGRLTAASSNTDGELNFITDLICWAHHFGWTEGLPEEIDTWKGHFFGQWGGLCSAVSYGAGASVAHQEPAPSRPDHLGPRHPESWQTHLHEVYYRSLGVDQRLWGIWVRNMFDYSAPRREGGEGGMNDLGLTTFDRKVKKDAYYLYKANWNAAEPFVHIVGRRRNTRQERTQNIKVYSNLGEAELFVNGSSAGVRTADNGILVWEGIVLRQGANRVEARSGDAADAVRIDITPAARQAL